MNDWKDALKKISSIKTDKQKVEPLPHSPGGDLSSYEEFINARKRLATENQLPLKRRDFQLILRLERLVRHFQAEYQKEVASLRGSYPSQTMEEISKIALNNRLAERATIEREVQANEARKLEEKERQAALEKVEQEKEKKLLAAAKKAIREKALCVCEYCDAGRIKETCATCRGTGRVTPYAYKAAKLVGGGIVERIELRDSCPERNCHMGEVFITCPHCLGTKITNAKGNPLTTAFRQRSDVVERIQELMGIF